MKTIHDVNKEGIAVHCETPEEYNRICNLAVSSGYWYLRKQARHNVDDDWNVFGAKTCIDIYACSFYDLRSFLKDGYKIIQSLEIKQK